MNKNLKLEADGFFAEESQDFWTFTKLSKAEVGLGNTTSISDIIIGNFSIFFLEANT